MLILCLLFFSAVAAASPPYFSMYNLFFLFSSLPHIFWINHFQFIRIEFQFAKLKEKLLTFITCNTQTGASFHSIRAPKLNNIEMRFLIAYKKFLTLFLISNALWLLSSFRVIAKMWYERIDKTLFVLCESSTWHIIAR